MYSKYVLRTCTDRLYVQAWNLWGLKLQKIYSQGMSRFTASVLDHRVGCWPFQGRDISKTQRMNIFLEAGRLPLRSIMTTGAKWGGVLVLWEDAGFHRIPHHKWHRRTQRRSKFLWFLLAGGRFFITNAAFAEEADRWEAENGGHALDGMRKNKLPTEQWDGK